MSPRQALVQLRSLAEVGNAALPTGRGGLATKRWQLTIDTAVGALLPLIEQAEAEAESEQPS